MEKWRRCQAALHWRGRWLLWMLTKRRPSRSSRSQALKAPPDEHGSGHLSDRIGGAQLRLNSARRGRGDSGPRARADRLSPRRISHGTSRFLSAPRLQFPNLEGGARYGFASFEGFHARRFAVSRRPADHSPMPEGELNLSAVALPRCDGTDVGTHARKGVAPQPAFVIKVMLGNS